MIGHAYDGLPDEACGLMAGTPVLDRVERFYATRNAAESSRVYTVDPKDHLRADRDAEDHGLEIIGVMHSHTHTEAYPSPTDVDQAPDPTWHYVIVSLKREAPVLRSYRIVDGHDHRGAGGRRRTVDSLPKRSAFRSAEPDAPTLVEPDPMAVYQSVLDMIGNTPMVDVSTLSPNPDVRILGKMEGQNPAGSVKDRIALNMILEAEANGTLKPGQTLIESSSGNTGIAMAMIAKTRGYPIKIVLPENVSIERRQLLEVFGAEIIDSPGEEGSNGAVRRAQALADEHPEWAFLFQYANEANPRAHYETTGPEIWADCPEITHFVAGLGTSGTLMGVGRFLKEQNPDIKVLAVEPPLGEKVEGLRNLEEGYIPEVYEKWDGADLLDGKRIVRPTRVHRVDPPPQRGRHLLRHLGRRGPGRRGPGRRADRPGHHRVRRVRRRLEVPLDRRLDRRHRRRRRAGREDHLLLTDRSFSRCLSASRGGFVARLSLMVRSRVSQASASGPGRPDPRCSSTPR